MITQTYLIIHSTEEGVECPGANLKREDAWLSNQDMQKEAEDQTFRGWEAGKVSQIPQDTRPQTCCWS